MQVRYMGSLDVDHLFNDDCILCVGLGQIIV